MMRKSKLAFLTILIFSLTLFLSGCSSIPTDPINQSPDADFSANPTSGAAPLTVTFDAANSSDPDGSIASYEWNFDDGSTDSGQTVDHTFDNTGNYDVELTVRDDNGASDTANLTVEVKDAKDPSYFEFNSATGTITGYDDWNGPSDVVIPSEINGVDVEVIGEGAFNALDNPIDSVEIPNTVTVIEPRAFRFNELTTVDIPDGVEEIKHKAFRLNKLTEVKIADTVTFIGEDAFRNNGDLVLVEIGEGVNIEGIFTFADNFEEVYEDHNKSAGTYKRDDKDSSWYKE